jgi:hypothetical protein
VTWPTDTVTPSPDSVAQALNGQIRQLVNRFATWRASINTTGLVGSSDALENYSQAIALRRNMTSWQGTTGLAAAIQRLYNQPSFDPATEGATVKSALDSFVTWFQTNWPKTAGGFPAFHSYDAVTGDITDFTITLAAAQKTAVLARIDAVLATFN